MSLSFETLSSTTEVTPSKECKEKDFTYSAPLYVSAEFMNNETR